MTDSLLQDLSRSEPLTVDLGESNVSPGQNLTQSEASSKNRMIKMPSADENASYTLAMVDPDVYDDSRRR